MTAEVALKDDEVHVWQAPLDRLAEQVPALAHTLSADELERSARFREARARSHFVVARGVLRGILGRYLNVAPAGVRFTYGQHGKPYLATDCAASRLQFSLAHANALVVVAVTRLRAVGVDVENVRPLPELEALARRYLPAREARAVLARPAAERHESFLRYWTDREACLKARGDGLSGAWERLDITALQQASAHPPFALRRLALPPGYVGAVAAAGSDWNVVALDFEERRDPAIL